MTCRSMGHACIIDGYLYGVKLGTLILVLFGVKSQTKSAGATSNEM